MKNYKQGSALIIILVVVIIIAAVYFIMTKSARETSEETTTNTPQTSAPSTNSAEGAPAGSIHNLSVPAGVAAARKQLAQKLNIAENTVVIMSAYEKDWSDACLGLAGPDEMCVAVITPGFEVTMQAQSKTYVYRTNTNGTVVRSEK